MGSHDGERVGGEGNALQLAGPGSVRGGRGVEGTAGREGSRGLRCTLQSQDRSATAPEPARSTEPHCCLPSLTPCQCSHSLHTPPCLVVPQISVGIITPYRGQRELIRETFTRLFGPSIAAEVKIETVDSFQVGSWGRTLAHMPHALWYVRTPYPMFYCLALPRICRLGTGAGCDLKRFLLCTHGRAL